MPSQISIHALLAESDKKFIYKRCKLGRFLSTLSLRRATKSTRQVTQTCRVFLSTLSLRRATLNLPSKPIDKNISIHALLAESDPGEVFASKPRRVLFLSTLSLRRATTAVVGTVPDVAYFYPRSPCGERLILRSP